MYPQDHPPAPQSRVDLTQNVDGTTNNGEVKKPKSSHTIAVLFIFSLIIFILLIGVFLYVSYLK